MDVNMAFFNMKLKVEIHIDQSEGFVQEGKKHLVYKLKKILYGLKELPKAW